MYNYVNGFHLSVKSDNSEVLIRFIQTLPDLKTGANGEFIQTEMKEEVVSSVVLNGALANELLTKLQELFLQEKK